MAIIGAGVDGEMAIGMAIIMAIGQVIGMVIATGTGIIGGEAQQIQAQVLTEMFTMVDTTVQVDVWLQTMKVLMV
jgi:hypothetical protein